MLGYGDFESLENLIFVSGWTTFYIGGVELDIMTKVKGLDEIGFDNCQALASIANLEGILVPFLHINHLIKAEEASARIQDLADIDKLKKIYNLA